MRSSSWCVCFSRAQLHELQEQVLRLNEETSRKESGMEQRNQHLHSLLTETTEKLEREVSHLSLSLCLSCFLSPHRPCLRVRREGKE